MAAALLTSGCGKFVRDELITMQNEMDQLYDQIKLMNDGLSSLQEIVRQMAAEGYIIKHEAFEEEGREGYKLYFRSIDAQGNVNDSEAIVLFSGVPISGSFPRFTSRRKSTPPQTPCSSSPGTPMGEDFCAPMAR